ncbi:unnamed protein product, partial [Porites lobata]
RPKKGRKGKSQAKEALLKQRLQQAKTFQIKNQISSSSHECFEELSDSESERACSLQQAKVSPSQQSHSSSLGYSGSLIMVDSESEPLNSSEDEYFPGDEEMHADDDFVGMEVTVPYRSPLKELFQKGDAKVAPISRKEKGSRNLTDGAQGQSASKVVPISRKEKGSRNLTDGAQGQSEYSIYSVLNFIQMHAYMYFVLQGASKVVPISRKEKGSRKLFYETDQEQRSQPALSKCGREECRLLRQENASLKQKVLELEQKLNDQYSEDTNKPLAGVISPVIASKHKMEEMAIGSGVFWYPTQRLNALAEGKSVGTMTAYLIDVMFDKKKTLMISNLAGGGNLGYRQLCPQIIKAITAFVQSQFKDGNVISKVRKTIQDKCTASRRGISKTK